MSEIWDIIENNRNNKNILYKNISYSDFYNRVLKLSIFISKLNNNIENIPIISELCIELFELKFACISLNSTFIYIDFNLDFKKIMYILNFNKSEIIFLNAKFYKLNNYIKKYSTIKYIIWINENIEIKPDYFFQNYYYTDIIRYTEIKQNFFIKNDKSNIIYYDERYLKGININNEIIKNQINFSINNFNLKKGDKILYLNNNSFFENNMWIYLTSMYLENPIFFSKDISLLNKFINTNNINYLVCLSDEIQNYLHYSDKCKIIYYGKKKNIKNIKIFNAKAFIHKFGNVDKNKNIDLPEKKIYMDLLLTDCKFIKDFFIYQINYLSNFNIYIISYKSKQSKNIEIYIFNYLNKYYPFKSNDRIYFRKLNKGKKKLNKKKNLLVKTDYYKCLSDLIISIKNNNIKHIFIENYVNSVYCKINNCYDYKKERVNSIQNKKIIEIINNDLMLNLSLEIEKDKLIHYIFKNIIYNQQYNINKFINKHKYISKYNTIIGIWITGNYSQEDLINSYKNIQEKFKFNLLNNKFKIYFEEYNKKNILEIIEKYSKLSNLISIIYLRKGEKKIIFIIFSNIIAREIKKILEIFFYDCCRECILKKNKTANYNINQNNKNINNIKLNEKLFNFYVIIDCIIVIFIIIINYCKNILKRNVCVNESKIEHIKISYKKLSKIKEKCMKYSVKIESFLSSIIMIGVSRNFSYSILKIKKDKSIYIPNLYSESKDNFWDLCKKMNEYLNNPDNYLISYLIKEYNHYFDIKNFSNIIFEIKFWDDILNICKYKKYNINNILVCSYNLSNICNCVFNIYYYNNNLNISLNSSNNTININKLFKYINYLINKILII